VVRGREVVLRDALLRAAGLRAVFAAPLAGFARDDVERDEVELLAREPVAALREAAGLARLLAVFLRAPPAVLRPLLELAELAPELELSSVHLPDITRCAASATASAMIEPSLVALFTMLLAAADAESAASSPASRIARRALGLALIAAAAAASPAASISLLIAALASLSTVLFAELDDEPDDLDDREEVFLVDLAIAYSPCVRCRKDTWRT
jgi:hypothetical protein